MAQKSIREETAEWRKLLRNMIKRLDQPMRLDREWTRGRYGVGYDPAPVRGCLKHTFRDAEGKFLYRTNDPFCRVCYP